MTVVLAFRSIASAGTIPVPPGADLQAALDRAQPGDVIVLQAGASYVGNFTLGAKDGVDFVTLRSSTPDSQLPPEGVRVTPAMAGRLARIQSPNANPSIKTAPGAHNWRLFALEFVSGPDGSGDMIRLGDGSSAQRTADSVAHDLMIDRCYLHGTPGAPQKRAVALNSAATAILNSWIADMKAVDQDSQAVAGWNGPGPFVIQNNYLEAAGENLLFGGADPSIDGLVPTGITIRDNWVRKSTGWRGSQWQVKNLLELKNARAVVIERNVFEDNWQAAQPGYAILFTPRNQDGRAPWAAVQDVTFRENVLRHVSGAINILGHDSPNTSQQTRNITISGNLIYDVSGQTWGGSGNFLQIGDGPANIVIEHNTALQTGAIITVYGGSVSAPARIPGFVFRSNLVLHNQYGIKGDSLGVGNATIQAYFPGAVITGNVIAGGQSGAYPSGNQFPSVDDFYAQFVAAPAENYALVPTSAFAKETNDGHAVGADEQLIQSVLGWALNNVRSGRPHTGPVVGTAKPRIGG